MKDIFLHLPVGADAEPVMTYGISLAQQFDAHLTAAAVSFRQLVVGSPFEGAAAAVIAGALQEDKARAESVAENFNAIAGSAGIRWDTRLVHDDPESVSEWFAARARHHDLVVCPQSDPAIIGRGDLLIEAALFSSGRPVIVVPYIQQSPATFDRVAVCWNGSANAARAVHDAMPFLKKAKAIEILHAAETPSPDESLKGIEIAAHLARHGLQVDVELLAAPDLSAADAVLSHVADSGANLIVMGAYGHSRLREFVLGGMTRDILRTMTVPTLLSH